MGLFELLWLFIILSSLQPLAQRQLLAASRRRILAKIAKERDATVITLIHRQEALRDHEGRVVAMVPHYAMSGGTLIALAADEIMLDTHAALGPIDPQLGQYPAASLVEVSKMPGRHSDETLLLADVGRKALRQVEALAVELLERHSPSDRARDVARILSTGVWTHDHPLMARDLEQFRLPVKVGVPSEERALMDLYPQPRGREPAVEYASRPGRRPGRPMQGP